ncbi:MAG: hypothetical protein GXY05_15890 [Clostridiales bacterium]|nr:hypothetical protein [Clostridiales bacterium]
MSKKEKQLIKEIIEEFKDSGEGESVHIADWLSNLLENAEYSEDDTDVELIVSSLEEIIATASDVIDRLGDSESDEDY